MPEKALVARLYLFHFWLFYLFSDPLQAVLFCSCCRSLLDFFVVLYCISSLVPGTQLQCQILNSATFTHFGEVIGYRFSNGLDSRTDWIHARNVDQSIMKTSMLLTLYAAVTVLAAPLRDEFDDDCSQERVTVWADSPTTTSASSVSTADNLRNTGKEALAAVDGSKNVVSNPAPTAKNTRTSSSATSTTSTHSTAAPLENVSSSSSGISTPRRPDGSAGFAVNGDYLKAPVATDLVPSDASIFTPEDGMTFNCSAFSDWLTHQREVVKPASKFLKIKPGTYAYQLGPLMKPGTDPNTVQGENIVFWLMSGGWTFDFRDVTFFVSITPENQNQRPNVMIYINQSEDLKILGGTIWIDQGEQWTQARVMSISPPDTEGNSKAVFQVEQGYNHTAWAEAGPRNQNCVDDSNPNHSTRPGCNFWKVQNYNFDSLDSDRTFSATLLGGSYLKKGYVVSMQVGPNALTTLSAEDEGGLHVKGLTSNGALMQIGLNGKTTAVFEEVWYVNSPPRPGYAPKVQGPVLSWGNLVGYNYDEPGEAKAILQNSYWQTTGSAKDVQDANNSTLPS